MEVTITLSDETIDDLFTDVLLGALETLQGEIERLLGIGLDRSPSQEADLRDAMEFRFSLQNTYFYFTGRVAP